MKYYNDIIKSVIFILGWKKKLYVYSPFYRIETKKAEHNNPCCRKKKHLKQ